MAFALKQVSMINTRRRNFDQNFTRTSFWRDHFGDGKDFRPPRLSNLNGSHASSIGHAPIFATAIENIPHPPMAHKWPAPPPR